MLLKAPSRPRIKILTTAERQQHQRVELQIKRLKFSKAHSSHSLSRLLAIRLINQKRGISRFRYFSTAAAARGCHTKNRTDRASAKKHRRGQVRERERESESEKAGNGSVRLLNYRACCRCVPGLCCRARKENWRWLKGGATFLSLNVIR